MRTGLIFLSAALVVGLGINATAQQQPPANSFFTGVNPQNIKLVPVDVSKAMATLNVNKAFSTPRPPTPFVLSNFFPKFTLPSWPPIKAATPTLARSPFETITPIPKKK
jgi:hypothetical protein